MLGKVLEITGFVGDSVEYLEWSTTGNTAVAGGPLFVDTSDNYAKYPRGLGTNLSISNLELSRSVKLIERGPEPSEMEKRPIIVSTGGLDQIISRDTLTSEISCIRNRSPKFNLPRSKPASVCSYRTREHLLQYSIHGRLMGKIEHSGISPPWKWEGEDCGCIGTAHTTRDGKCESDHGHRCVQCL